MSLTEQLRRAIDESGRTRYRLAKETGISQESLHRFYHGERGLSTRAIDLLAEALDLELKPKRPTRRKTKGR
jgi:transcriptional regulator with XRE-family HTH domain